MFIVTKFLIKQILLNTHLLIILCIVFPTLEVVFSNFHTSTYFTD
jgi:hypothetical protein